MTPQQLLMDMNGYGSASKYLIKLGMYKHITALEVLRSIDYDYCTPKVSVLINEAIAILEKMED